MFKTIWNRTKCGNVQKPSQFVLKITTLVSPENSMGNDNVYVKSCASRYVASGNPKNKKNFHGA
jgi:hypothetical protein